MPEAEKKPRARTERSSTLNSEILGTFKRPKNVTYLSLTSHPGRVGINPIPIKWAAKDPLERGPIICTNTMDGLRNAIGAHSGSYSIYRALAIASGTLDPEYRPNYERTEPAAKIEPNPAWFCEQKISTFDPWGALTKSIFTESDKFKEYDIRPTIAITRAHVDLPEIKNGLREGRLKADGVILASDGSCHVTKAAIEPAWYLPEIARRFECTVSELRELLFRETNGMFPELITRTDLKVFLPPIGGMTAYIFGDPELLKKENVETTVRVHDECNGSDVFGSDICTCRPYLIHGIEAGIKTAQQGGVGVVVYFRKEGRALGEVTKYLVYNARKRQEHGDSAKEYFNCTENVAGVQDSRFQTLMPDCLHWLGIKRIDNLLSMSNMKYNAIVNSGIEVVNRVPLPEHLVPKDAQVEIDAKVYAGYEGGTVYDVNKKKLESTIGRTWEGHAGKKEPTVA